MKIEQPLTLTATAPTAGGLTVATAGLINTVLNKYSWTNAMITALGATTTGDLTVCTLPAKTLVKKAFVVITGQAAGTTTLTLAVGRTTALFIDYIVAKDAKVAANTVYGQLVAELGTNLSALTGDLPSLSGTTDIKMHLISTVQNLSSCTGSSGDIYLETIQLP